MWLEAREMAPWSMTRCMALFILLEFSSQYPSLVVHYTCSCSLSNWTPSCGPTCTHMHKYTSYMCPHIQRCITWACMPHSDTWKWEKRDHNPSLLYLLELFQISASDLILGLRHAPGCLCFPGCFCKQFSFFSVFSLLAPVATKGKGSISVLGTMSQIFSSDENTVGFSPETRVRNSIIWLLPGTVDWTASSHNGRLWTVGLIALETEGVAVLWLSSTERSVAGSVILLLKKKMPRGECCLEWGSDPVHLLSLN